MLELDLDTHTETVPNDELICEVCGDDLNSLAEAKEHITDHHWPAKIDAMIDYQQGDETEAMCRLCGWIGPRSVVNRHIVQDAHRQSKALSVLAFGTTDYFSAFEKETDSDESD